MERFIKRVRIFSIIMLWIELLIFGFLLLITFVDLIPGAKKIIEENNLIFVITAVFLVADWSFLLWSWYRLKRIRYKGTLATADLFGETVQNSLQFAKVGIVVADDNHNIIWTNEVINQTDERLLDKNILDLFPALRDFHKEGSLEEQSIRVTLKDVVFEVSYVKSCNVYFFYNINDYFMLHKYSVESAIVLGIVMIDNYDELAKGQEETSDTLARVQTTINEYFNKHGAILRKYEKNSYFVICNYLSLEGMKKDGFTILDSVKEIADSNEVAPTLSIALSHDFPSIQKLHEMAKSTIDIAISRGGDQVIVSKFAQDLEFFGGRSEGIEKRNKVKVRILSDSIFSLLKGAKNVLVMGHKDMDMDALGSCLGIKAICDCIGTDGPIPCHIIYDPKLTERKARNAFSSSFSKEDVKKISISPKDALTKITSKTILICVDFHRPSLAFSKEVLDKCDKVIVIDHHRRSEEFIENPIYTYFEITASSASELITELIYYSSSNPKVTIPPAYATIMLAGIFLDTNYYRSTTSGFRTFEASMILRSFGADNVTADDFLKDEYEEHLLISKILSNIKTPMPQVVYCANPDSMPVDQATLAKVANQCINMKDISAAFAIGKITDNEIKISARSDGNINVQLICEKLGGGGHFTMAAATVKSKSIDEVCVNLEEILKIYLDDAKTSEQGD